MGGLDGAGAAAVEGRLEVVVWPSFIGAATHDPGAPPHADFEPELNPWYQRGQIMWDLMPNGEIIGRGDVRVPNGVYTHFVYARSERGDTYCGFAKLDHPIVMDHPSGWGIIHVEPIVAGNEIVTDPGLQGRT